jgi:hypothetical protein
VFAPSTNTCYPGSTYVQHELPCIHSIFSGGTRYYSYPRESDEPPLI